MTELHRCRLIEWTPSPVVALAPSVDGSFVAAARENGEIEVWRAAAGSVGWFCQLRIPGQSEAAISSLIWCESGSSSTPNPASPCGRLLSSGLDGLITEWDLGSLSPKAVCESYGGPVWAMAVEPRGEGPQQARDSTAAAAAAAAGEVDNSEGLSSSGEDSESEGEGEEDGHQGAASSSPEERMAVACDDGCVRLFTVSQEVGGGVQFQRAMPRIAGGRVLSVAWSNSKGKLFAGGSDGCIRCWDVSLARELFRMTAGTGGLTRKVDLCVWSLLSLNNGTLVSGDSAGVTQFWESGSGTLIQSQHRHSNAGVLALAATPSQDTVFAAGVDGQVVMYQLLSEESASGSGAGSGPWAYVGFRRSHSRDVRALAMAVVPPTDQAVEASNPTAAAAGSEGTSKVLLVGKKKQKEKKKRSSLEPPVRPVPSTPVWRTPGVPMLLSGGNDAQLWTYPANSFMAFYPHAVCAAPQTPHMTLQQPKGAGESNRIRNPALLLVQQTRWVDVWRVFRTGESEEVEEGEHTGLANGIASPVKANGVLGKRKSGEKVRLEGKAKKLALAGMQNGVSGHCETESPVVAKVRKSVSVTRAPVMVARIKSKSAEHIDCSALSPDGKLLAFSDWSRVRLYELGKKGKEGEEEGELVVRRRKLPEGIASAHKMVFSADSSSLVVAARNGDILVIDLAASVISHREPPPTSSSTISSDSEFGQTSSSAPTSHLLASDDGKWLAVADCNGRLRIFDALSMRLHWRLPSLDGTPITALKFHSIESELVVASATNEIHVLNIDSRSLSSLSKYNHGQPLKELLELPGGITGLSMGVGKNCNKLVAYSPRSICNIDLGRSSQKYLMNENVKVEGKSSVKKSQRPSEGVTFLSQEKTKSCGLPLVSIKAVPMKDPVLFLAHLGEASILVVEKSWVDTLTSLPPPMYRHKYGS